MADTPLMSRARQTLEDARADARLAEVHARIRHNFPPADGTRDGTLRWDHESPASMISACGQYRIRWINQGGKKVQYSVWLTPTRVQAAEQIAGPFAHPKTAREAAQAYQNGEPMQVELAEATQ